jgi:hypothetical protein
MAARWRRRKIGNTRPTPDQSILLSLGVLVMVAEFTKTNVLVMVAELPKRLSRLT